MRLAANSEIDTYNTLSEWEIRSKLIAFALLTFAFALVKSIILVPIMLIICSILLIISGISIRSLFCRLKIPGIFIIFMSLFILLFSRGTAIYCAGPLSISMEGIQSMVLLVCRFTAILTLLIVLLETTPLLNIITAMRSLGLPQILTDMTLFTLRYLYVIEEELRQMKIALTIRGFKGKSISDWKQYAVLIGAVLLRSYTQSERLYHALILRGYGTNCARTACKKWNTRDHVLSGSFAAAALIIIYYQIFVIFPGA